MNDPTITLPLARLPANPERKQPRTGTPYMLIRVAATGGHMDKTTKQWVDHDTMWATIFEYDLRLPETYDRSLLKGTPVRAEGVLNWQTDTYNQGRLLTDFIIEHATISLAMLKAKNQQSQQDQQTGNQWTGTNTFGPTSSFNQTGDEWSEY